MDEPTQALIERAQANDGAAADLLFERYRRRMRRGLSRMVGPAAATLSIDTEDVVQDALLAALRSIGRFEYRGEGSFLAWLLQTGKRELLHRLRAAQTQKRAGTHHTFSKVGEPAAHDAAPSQVAMGHELEARLQHCLDMLPEKERTAVMLARYLDCAADEIAEQMNLASPGAARALLSRAQARLARSLDELGDDSSTDEER